MSAKLTEKDLRRKCRSLETMLSRARVERDDALGIAAEAVNAVKELRNGQEQKAVETFGRAQRAAEGLARALRAVVAAAAAAAGAGAGEGAQVVAQAGGEGEAVKEGRPDVGEGETR